MPIKTAISLYLAKLGVNTLDSLLTEKAQHLINSGKGWKIPAEYFASGGALFIFPGIPIIPKWVKFLEPTFLISKQPTSQSPSAVLIFKTSDRIFAICFSYVHVYIDDSKIEADFGLKSAINSINDRELRSVERANIGAAIRDFAQAAHQRELKEFGFDEALDLIRKVSGFAMDDDFADLITGAKALRISKKMELADVPEVATQALTLFESNIYQNTSFKIIDFLSPVLDVQIAKNLENELVKSIQQGSDEFEVAIPDIIPSGMGTFRFERMGHSKYYPSLSLDIYREELGIELSELSVDHIKKHRIAAYSEAGDTRIDSWPLRQALVGTIALNDKRYALNEGVWYRIDQEYKDTADNVFNTLKK